MQLSYQLTLHGQALQGAVETAAVEMRGALQYGETVLAVQPGVAVALCEERDAALPVTRCWLEVRNSVFGTGAFENEMPVSDRPGGGTGTKSIARIVHSHGGMLRFQQDGDAFFVQIILPLSH